MITTPDPKFLDVYKITFSKNMNGQLIKKYEGILKPKDFEGVESGISIVLQHLYLHKMAPKGMFGVNYCPDSLFEIIISKNVKGHFRVGSSAAELTPNDCENIITGLAELLIVLHLERMEITGQEFTLKKDSVDFTPESQLV